jgi:nitroreductase
MKSLLNTGIFDHVAELGHVEPAVATDPEEFEKVVRSRRSVRVYTETPVPEIVMRKCLELALLAPNSSNLQPWEFYWVRDRARKKRLVELCLSQPAAATAQELVVCIARRDTWKRNRRWMLDKLEAYGDQVPESALQYYQSLVPWIYGQGPLSVLAPLKKLVANLIGLKKPFPRGPAGKSDMRVWAHKSTALACENLMLALRAFGFDSCPMEGIDEVRIRKLLRLPRVAEICMVIAAGKRADGGIYGKQLRFDKSQFVFEV